MVVIVFVAVKVDVGVGVHDVGDIVLDTSSNLRCWGGSGKNNKRGEAGAVLDGSLAVALDCIAEASGA